MQSLLKIGAWKTGMFAHSIAPRWTFVYNVHRASMSFTLPFLPFYLVVVRQSFYYMYKLFNLACSGTQKTCLR